jgi:hypothetical protein
MAVCSFVSMGKQISTALTSPEFTESNVDPFEYLAQLGSK